MATWFVSKSGEWAKATELRPLTDAQITEISDMLHDLRAASEAAGSWRLLWGRMSSQLARACAECRIARISIYTTRPVGMATAKRWMTQEQVVACAGHRSTRTAGSHYARRASGWKTKKRRGSRAIRAWHM